MNPQELIAQVKDHARGMWRFRWIALGVSWAVALGLAWVVYTMPNVYEASARVSVDTNSLLPSLTKGLTASENLTSEVELVSKALLTRPNLEAVARETDLDLRAETSQEMELLVTGLQRRVKIAGGRDKIFNISFEDRSRDMARDVVAALLNTFVETSLGAQGDDADMTERALALEIEDHEKRLLEAEQELAEFKKRNIGYMPDDGTDYYTRLQVAVSTVDETQRQIRLLRQKRDEISRQLVTETPVQSVADCSQAGNISELEAQLAQLRVTFTDKHPRIVMLRDTIANLRHQCETEVASTPSLAALSLGAGSPEAFPVYQNLRLQLSNTEVELAALQEQLSTSQREVAQLRADVDKIAEVESSLKGLNRDYGVIEGRHQELLRRWETLQSKKRLDPVTDKVQFNVLEPPFAPANPIAPNRMVLMLGALIVAIGAGVAIAFGLNQLRPVFFTRHSIAKVAGLPVLGSVSMIMSPDRIDANRRKTLAWAGANAMLVVFAVLLIVFEQPVTQTVSVLMEGAGM